MNGFTPRAPQDLSLIEKALAAAEQTTRGRINTVYGRDAGNLVYGLVSASYGLLAAIVVAIVSMIVGLSGWALLIAQATLFVAVFCALFFTGLRVRATPKPLKRLFVNQAVRRFAAANGFASSEGDNAETVDDPAIMLLVLRREGFAQIVASPDAAKAIPKKVWRTLLDALLIDLGHGDIAKGLRNTVMACTKLLTVYFPRATTTGLESAHGGHMTGNRLQLV